MAFCIDHDYHIHSNLSTCCNDKSMTAQAILEEGKALGLREIIITNHLWDRDMPGADEWYGPQDIAFVSSILPLPQAESLRLRFGCETEFCGGVKVGLSPAHYDVFDFIVVPFNHLHNNFSRPVDCTSPEQVALLYVDHLEDLLALPLPWQKTGIPHLTCHLTYPHPNIHEVFDLLDTERMRRIFDTLAERGAGIELNAGCFKPGWEQHEDSHLRLYRLAKEAGCKFYCASDAHSVDAMVRLIKFLTPVIETLGLGEKDRFRV